MVYKLLIETDSYQEMSSLFFMFSLQSCGAWRKGARREREAAKRAEEEKAREREKDRGGERWQAGLGKRKQKRGRETEIHRER